MSIVEKDMSIIEHILRYCEDITQAKGRFGDSIENFESDTLYRHSCSMCILQIGELSGRLSDDFKRVHDKIPWRNVKSMRNFLAHEYKEMDVEKTWETLTHDIPALSLYCSNILDDYNTPEQPDLKVDYEQANEDELEL